MLSALRRRKRLLVIAHRGASGYRPEHTLSAYQLALDQGADFIEPDLVATRDGILICRHENALALLNPDDSLILTDSSTDVYRHDEFRNRLTEKSVDGRILRGWFSEDFTLAEIKKLRAVERIPGLRPHNTRYDYLDAIPTFSEVLDLIKSPEERSGNAAGVYPETKHPTYFLEEGTFLNGQKIRFDLGRALVKTLWDLGFTDPRRIFIQSFESANLRTLKNDTLPEFGLEIPLIQLIEADGAPYETVRAGRAEPYQLMIQPAGLSRVARYASGIGPDKSLLIPRDGSNSLSSPTGLLRDAHAVGLEVHAWTFRAENYFLPTPYRTGKNDITHGAIEREFFEFINAGVDGVFSDQPDLAVKMRDA